MSGSDETASRIRVEAALIRSDSEALRERAAAMRAASAETQAQARAVGSHTNILLETAIKVVGEFLADRGIALAEPVSARLHTTPQGSTGVDVTVRVEDPGQTAAVQAAIDAHFGEAGVDVVRVS
jgi:hypothetical protein